MRILRTIALTGVVLGLAAALIPAQAQCGAAQQVTSVTPEGISNVWLDGWGATYYAPASVVLSTDDPLTPAFFGVFWGLGTGDTAYTLGDDSGTWYVSGLTKSAPPAPTWIYAKPDLSIYRMAAQVFGTWAQDQGIDGCVGTDTCECVLMTDESGGVGYFAIATGRTDAGGNLNLLQAGTVAIPSATGGTADIPTPIVLKPMPAPVPNRIDREANFDLSFDVTVAAPVDGVYEKDGCSCGPNFYVVYQQILDAGAPPPTSRNAADGWIPVTTATPIGTSATFTSACGATDTVVYLAAGLVFDSDMPGGPYPVTLSESYAEPCGPNIADPVDLKPRIRHQPRGVPRPERDR